MRNLYRYSLVTFTEHTQAVWNAAFNDTGDFLASCSLDHSARLWDLHSNRCRVTFRGHVDSVNEVCWQPFTNNIATGSSDKTVSLWDMRTGLCAQTFYGGAVQVECTSPTA
jgi:WD40 repeat protein